MHLTSVLEINGVRSNTVRIHQSEKVICRYYGDTPAGYCDISRHFLVEPGFWFFDVIWCAVDRFETGGVRQFIRFKVQAEDTILFKLSKCV